MQLSYFCIFRSNLQQRSTTKCAMCMDPTSWATVCSDDSVDNPLKVKPMCMMKTVVADHPWWCQNWWKVCGKQFFRPGASQFRNSLINGSRRWQLDCYDTGKQTLVLWYDKCLNNSGDYVEKSSSSSSSSIALELRSSLGFSQVFHHLFLSIATFHHSFSPSFLMPFTIESSHRSLGWPTLLFPSILYSKIVLGVWLSSTLLTCPAHLSLEILIEFTILGNLCISYSLQLIVSS